MAAEVRAEEARVVAAQVEEAMAMVPWGAKPVQAAAVVVVAEAEVPWQAQVVATMAQVAVREAM
eukprot:133563-Prymnesium_polylepis.2